MGSIWSVGAWNVWNVLLAAIILTGIGEAINVGWGKKAVTAYAFITLLALFIVAYQNASGHGAMNQLYPKKDKPSAPRDPIDSLYPKK